MQIKEGLFREKPGPILQLKNDAPYEIIYRYENFGFGYYFYAGGGLT
jgi:hypothetical protein